ncbi:general substrate transporter [Aspergillus karnatakaensis]|uniref:general substrate transporter n=1 Tax=Aspergillus karnatakaensis TaxID=1810916 RepID=UPI003CCE21F8
MLATIKKFKKEVGALPFTPRLLTLYIFISLGALNFGFDNGWWACVLPLEAFISYYAPPGSESIPSTWQSAGTGTANAGLVIGCMIAGACGNKLGRKWSIVLLVAIALVGMVIQNAIKSYWAVMAGRMVNAISMGIEANVIPAYMAELAPPAIRGTLVGFYQFWQFIGVLLATCTVFGSRNTFTNTPDSQWAFRVVMLVQVFIPLLLLGAVFFFPESPRWLLQRGKRDEARTALLYIRAGATSTLDVETELSLLESAIDEQRTHHRATSYRDCFVGSNGRRTFIAATTQVLQQLQGNSFFSGYSVIYMAQLGIQDPLQAQMGRVACGLGGVLIGLVLIDRLGRRPLMLACSIGNWVTLWLSSGLSAWGPDTQSVVQVNLACVLLWMVFNSLGWGACVWIVTSEMPTLQLRERTISIATSCSFLAVLVISYVNPFVQNEPGNLGSKVGFVYGSFSVIAVAFIWFCLPEASGRSFEELDEMFQAGVKAWRFEGYRTVGVGARITEIQGVVVKEEERGGGKKGDEEDVVAVEVGGSK